MDLSAIGNLPQVRGRGSTAKTNAVSSQFDVALHRAASAGASQDTVDISSLSYQQRLTIIRKEHEETDYSNMSAVEAGQTILKRFEDAFPDMWAGFGGLYGSPTTIDLATGQTTKTIYGNIQDEFYNQLQVAEDKLQDSTPPVDLARDLFGYTGSEQEIQNQIMGEFQGSTMVDRGNVLGKLMLLDIGNGYAESGMMYTMTTKLYDLTRTRFSHLGRYDSNPLRMAQMVDIAHNQAMSWTQLKHATLASSALAITDSDKNQVFADYIQKQLDEFWEAF